VDEAKEHIRVLNEGADESSRDLNARAASIYLKIDELLVQQETLSLQLAGVVTEVDEARLERRLSFLQERLSFLQGQLTTVQRERDALEAKLSEAAKSLQQIIDAFNVANQNYNTWLVAQRDSDTLRPLGNGLFAPFLLPAGLEFAANSNKNNKARRTNMVNFAAGLEEDITRFQKHLSSSAPALMAMQFGTLLPLTTSSETDFTRYFRDWFGPRLEAILKAVLGVHAVVLELGAEHDGADLFLSLYGSEVHGPRVRMPLEAKTAFGAASARGYAQADSDLDKRNFGEVDYATINVAGGRYSARNIVNGVHQVCMYIGQQQAAGNYGALFSSECLFLVRRTAPGAVDVSVPIPLNSREPHPVAAIAWWAAEVYRYPKPLVHQLLREPQGVEPLAQHSAHEVGSGITSPVTRSTARRSQDAWPPHTSSPGGGIGGNMSTQPDRNPRARSMPKDETAVLMQPSHLPSPDSLCNTNLQLDGGMGFDEFFNFGGMVLEPLATYRSGVVYRCRLDGQDAVVKTALSEKRDLVAELSVELRAYHRLKDLQGVCIPRIFRHGWSWVGGSEVSFIAMQYLHDPSLCCSRMTEQ
ncbi:hypothetical protein H4R26_005571, partial [Coemansia thaxteri]